MSVANPLSPRHDHHSFLPHGQISTTSRTPPTSFSSLPQTTRTQSSTITSTSSASGFPVSSKSAPSSPLNRPHLPQGLAPLSSISSIQLDLSSQFQPGQLYQRKSSSPLPSSLAAQQAGPSQQGPQPAQARSVFFSSGALARPSALSRNDCSRSRTPTINRPGSSSEDTETELESDSTFVPGRVKHKQSLSQPDLTALRSWVGRVAQGQLEERRARDARGPRFPTLAKNTPASRSIPTKAQASTFGRTPLSKSQPSLVALRGPPSPRQTSMIPPMTPVFSRHYLSSMSEGSSIPKLGSSGITGSEDADDDYESNDSPSSGSLTFSPKRTRRPRQRDMAERSKLLGLTLEPAAKVDEAAKEEPIPAFIERRLQQSSLLSLRLLAIAPSLWGICVLVQALATGVLWHDVWPWGVDLSRDALERLVQGGMGYEGTWRPVSRGDMLLSIAWVGPTAFQYPIRLMCSGCLHRTLLLLPDDRTHPSLAIVLLASLHHHPPRLASMPVLSGNLYHPMVPRRGPAPPRMDRHRRDDWLEPHRSDVGDV